MNIQQIEVFPLKIDYHYQIGAHKEMPNRLPGTDYYLEPQWPHAYSGKAESCVVKLTTDDGVTGWGEASAPLTPETVCSILTTLVGPAVIGSDPMSHEVIYDRLYHLMDVRGHTSGFMMDALAAIDIAVWDIKGKVKNEPICRLLGGPFQTELPAYVSGLRQPTIKERCKVAHQVVNDGFQGVKLFLGKSIEEVTDEFLAINEAVGDKGFVALDVLCKYDLPEAIQLGRLLDKHSAGWLEAPLNPDDVDGHAELNRRISTPVAVGEHLRSVQEFMPWFQKGALHIAQPDVPRTGITAAKKIAEMAAAYHRKIALHFGLFTGIGVAATWQVAAALPNFLIQEHQLELFDHVNQVLESQLKVEHGKLMVPMDPGLGVEVNEEFVRANASQSWIVDSEGRRE